MSKNTLLTRYVEGVDIRETEAKERRCMFPWLMLLIAIALTGGLLAGYVTLTEVRPLWMNTSQTN